MFRCEVGQAAEKQDAFGPALAVAETGAHLIFSRFDTPIANLTDKQQIIYKGIEAKMGNCILASARLVKAGYYGQALSIERDLIESLALLVFFMRNDDKILDWKSLSPQKRREKYGTSKLIALLADFNEDTSDEIARYYKIFSENGTHVGPEVAGVLFDGSETRLGPYFSERRANILLGALADLTILAAKAAGTVYQEPAADLSLRAAFDSAAKVFRDG